MDTYPQHSLVSEQLRVREIAPALLIFNRDGRLWSFSETAAALLGLDRALLHPGLAYDDLRRLLTAQGLDVAALPPAIPPDDGSTPVTSHAVNENAARMSATLLPIDGVGYGLVLARTGNGETDALRQSVERYREFTELAADWEWEMDAEARFTGVSARYREIDAIPLETLIGKTRWELDGSDPDKDELWRRHRADYLAHRPFRNFRYSGRDPSGRMRYWRINGNPVFTPDGRFVGYRGVTHDETEEIEARQTAERGKAELLRAKEAAELSEQRYREFTELASDWQWETDAEHRFSAISDRYFDIVDDVPRTSIIGRTRWEVTGVDPEQDRHWRHHLDDLRAHRPFRNFRYSDTDSKGRRRHFRVSGNPVLASDGRFVGYRGVANDETKEMEARREAERRRSELLEAKEAAEQSEARYREFAELASDWEWETDAEGHFTRVSERYRDCNDLPLEQLIGKTRWELAGADPDSDPLWARHRADYLARRPIRDFVYSPRDASGRLRHFRVSGNPVYTPDRTFVGYRGVVHDETQQVEARNEARRAEALLRAALDALPEGVALYDPEDRLVLFNRTMLESFGPNADILEPGRRFEEILRAALARGLFPSAAGRKEEFVAERLAGHNNPGGVARYQGGGGRWVEASNVRTPDGYILGLRVDITDRLIAERKLIEVADSLAEKNRLLDLALENASNGIVFHDVDGRLVLWNRRYVELYNLPPDQLRVGMHLGEQMALSQRIGNYSMEEGKRVTRERLAILDSRERRVFRQTLRNGAIIEGTHVPLAGGGSVSTFVDITERERRQHELITSKEAAELANRAKTDFLANVSHELRTPLNAVIGFSEVLMLEYFGTLTEKQRDYLADIRASGTFLLTLIDDLLDLTKIEVSKEQLSREPIPLADLVRGCCRMVSARFGDRGPQLRIELPDVLPPFEADQRKLRQIVINLLTNAFKFTPPGGTVVLSAKASGDWLELGVSDTGVGISPDDLSRVMEPFYRAEGPFARRFEGAGLGLPLAKALAELHGGTLEIASELGVGTTATLRLPLRPPS